MKLLTFTLFSIPSLVYAQIDTNLFSQVEQSKLIETKQVDWGKIERHEKGTIVYTNEGFGNPGPEKRIEIEIDSTLYSRHFNKYGIFHYKTDLKSTKSLKHGKWTSYHGRSAKLVEVSCTYVNDTLDGEYLLYENNSAGYLLENRVSYQMGIPNGPYEEYDQNGQLKVRGQFLNGEKVGVWIINENEYHQPEDTEYNPSCQSCYITTKSIYREFYSDGIIDTEIEIGKSVNPCLSEYMGGESDDKPEVYDFDDAETKELKSKEIKEWERRHNLLVAPMKNSKLIRTEHYKNNVLISCEGECK